MLSSDPSWTARPPARGAYVAPTGTKPQPLRLSSAVSSALELPAAAARTAFNAAAPYLAALHNRSLYGGGQEPWIMPATVLCTRLRHTVVNKQRCPINCVAWMPPGDRVLTGGSSGEFVMWSGTELGRFETIVQAHDGAAVRTMVWSPGNNWLVSGDDAGTIKIWQPTLNNVKKLPGAHTAAVRSIAFSPSADKLVSGGDDNTVRIWDFHTAREERLCAGHGQEVRCVDWHPTKGLVASCAKDSCAKLFDPRTGLAVRTMHAHNLGMNTVAWSPDGTTLLTAGRDKMLKSHDMRRLDAPVCVYRGHADEVCTAVWSAESPSVFVSGGLDGTIGHWLDGDPDPLIIIKPHESAVWALAWHPAGVSLLSGSNDFSTKIWARSRPSDPTPVAYVPPPPVALALPLSIGNFHAKGSAGPPAGYTCHGCGISGHWRVECPNSTNGTDTAAEHIHNSSSSSRKRGRLS